MSISNALNHALTGLSASAKAAQITASNISNALTPGYGVRSLELASQGQGSAGGVQLVGITRTIDAGLLSDRRIAQANYVNGENLTQFQSDLLTLVGEPGQDGALTQRFADFEAALVSASSRPDEQIRLDQVSQTAELLTDKFNAISDGLQTLREEADAKISQMVIQLGTALEQVQTLNTKIAKFQNAPDGALSLIDSRQQIIDQISEIVPIRTIERDSGALAIFTTGGAVLLDGPAPNLDFTQTTTIEPHFSVDNGLLSGITLNGKNLNIDPENGPLQGGALAAQLAIRDHQSFAAHETLDGLAADLVTRFQDSSVDASLTAGDPGIFTDQNSFFSGANELGLAGRLSLNNSVSLNGAAETWRLRDGLNASTSGPIGDATLLNAMHSQLTTALTPASSNLPSAARSSAELAASFTTTIATAQVNQEQELSFLSNHYNTLLEQELAQGVDTDQQLQQLLLVEQIYAANAKMIQTADDLLETLLGI